MTRGIDDIELVFVPEAGSRSGLNGDPPLLLLIHEICGCCTFMYLTSPMDLASQLEDSFGGGSLTCIDVCKDTNISIAGEILHN